MDKITSLVDISSGLVDKIGTLVDIFILVDKVSHLVDKIRSLVDKTQCLVDKIGTLVDIFILVESKFRKHYEFSNHTVCSW